MFIKFGLRKAYPLNRKLRAAAAASLTGAMIMGNTVVAGAYQEYVSSTVTVSRAQNGAIVCAYSNYKDTITDEKEEAAAQEVSDLANDAFFEVIDRLKISQEEFEAWEADPENPETKAPIEQALNARSYNEEEKRNILESLSFIYATIGATKEFFDLVQRDKVYDELNTRGATAEGAKALHAELAQQAEALKVIVDSAEAGQATKDIVDGKEIYQALYTWKTSALAPALTALNECQTKSEELKKQSENPSSSSEQPTGPAKPDQQPGDNNAQGGASTSSEQSSASESSTESSSSQDQKPSEQPGDKKEPTDKGSSKPVIAGIVAAAIAGLIGLIAVAAPMLAKIFPPLAALLNR